MADADEELSAYEGEGETAELLEQEEVEEESILTEYDTDDFYSGAVNTLDSTIPLDLFEFEHSYGYNCHKYFNLCACDETVVCWASGSIITFMDVNTKQTWFRRSTTGGSVGNISSFREDPNYRIAIAEGREGDKDPLILVYTWPQMEIDAILRDGTTNAYSILDFSPDGEMLASVGMEPDYNLTIWNWKRHKILLRTSAFTFDVNAVMFSPYCPGQLTTAGAAHIKFWKMAKTFTGLKLKGELGRFGKTEICDVLGVYPMPDEKVLSGCEWGNVLVWEAGLVKVEVTQRGRKTCHKAAIIQFMLSPAGDEVTTIARDGCIRAWYWDTVEQSDPPEDDPYVELNPVAETCVPGCQIMCLKHQKDFYWYAQDGNGGLWCADIEIDKLECNHRKVFTCHAGGIVAMAVLRFHPILVTAGKDGALHVYSTENHVLLARYVFPTPVSCMLYPPVEVDKTSRIIMVGFSDGIMRTLLLHPERLQNVLSALDIRVHSALTIHSDDSEHPDVIDMISLLKPHSKSISQMTINEQHTLLLTCGQDTTIFLYKLILGTPFTLERLGFIETPNNIAYMTWKPEEEYVVLLCGQVGFIMEAVLPQVDVRKYSEITTFRLEFVSWKEVLVKKHFMRNRPFPTEEDLASIDEEALKAASEAEKNDDEEVWLGEIQLMESESMLGTTITWAEYCEEGIWVIQKGTGALLLVKPGVAKILKYGPFPGAWCDDITALKFVCEGRYLIIGTNTGYIRVVRMPFEDEDSEEHHYVTWLQATQKLLKKLKGRRLAKDELQPTPRIDFTDNYYLPMHDRYTGAVTCLEFSSNGKYLYTSGADGNIFSYRINFTEPLFPSLKLPPAEQLPKTERMKEPSTIDGELMSHEQLKQKEEFDKMMAIANAHKKRVRDQLSELAFEYNKLIKANKFLPVSQQINVTLDPRPLQVQEDELNVAKALTIRKLAHQLEASDLALHKMYSRNIIQLDVFPFILKAIRDPEVIIRPLRQKNLSQAFFDQLEEVHQKMAEAALRGRRAESTTRRAAVRKPSWGPPRVASFLLGLPPRPPHPLNKALRNYYQRLNRHHLQFIEWQEHLSHKPDPNAMPPGAAEALKEAEESIGNRVLKTHPDYVAPPGHNTQLRVCLLRKEIYDSKRVFNEKVLQLRDHKVHLVKRMKQIGERLAEIRVEIPAKVVRQPPAVPEIDDELEFPERNLEVKPEVKYPGARQTGKKPVERSKSQSNMYPQARVRQSRVARFIPLMDTRPLVASWELLKVRQDIESTPVETEIRERRVERHLYEQDMLLADAEMSVRQFDFRVRALQRERIRVQESNQLLELNLCQLHREMNVLNRFEAHEDRLAERVYVKLMQVRGVQDQIVDCQHRIEEHFAEKENLDLLCQDLQRQFKKLAQDNKSADFLRRIFKKKYRAPRDRDADGAKLFWPDHYHLKGFMSVPSANLKEPFEVWADRDSKNYRVAFYYGLTNIIKKQIENESKLYMVGPESTVSYGNKMVCRQLATYKSYAAAALNEALLPLSGHWDLMYGENLDGIKTYRWEYSTNITEYGASLVYTVWTRTQSIVVSDKNTWEPIRQEYQVLQGNRRVQFIRFDYTGIDTSKVDPDVFNIGIVCPYSNETTDPILKHLNPVQEHSRTSGMFERFKLKHNKQYKTHDEHSERLRVFRNNLKYIESMNRQQESYTMAVNQFADMTQDELSVFLGTEMSPEAIDSIDEFMDDIVEYEEKIPSSFDWSAIGAVTSVKDQTLLCGSCYAFATAAVVESAAYISRGCRNLENVSEQAIIDCSWQNGNKGCEGGKTSQALQWIKDHGIPFRKDYGPYLATAGYCHNNQLRLLSIPYFRRVLKREESIKVKTDSTDLELESSEESESSSSSEEDDEGSVDSRDIGPFRLDPNVCPEGCDPDVYEKTYELRNTRHKHEQDMIEQDRLVELLRKDIDAHNKVKRKLSIQLDQRKNELREFMLEKQNCLNEVDQVIVLRYDQIRASAIRGCTGPEGLSKTVVFPEAMLMKLRRRVLELQDEIRQQKQRQKVNRTHLFRMNVDIKAMEAQAEELRAQMRDVLTRKLGKPRRVDKTLDDLLRQMARRHKFSTTLGVIPQVLQQLRNWRDRYGELEKKYLEILNRHSDRLRLGAALQADVLPQKPPKKVEDMAGGYDADTYQRDVVRLRIVRSQQLHQIKAIREEIKSLRLKPQSPRAPLPSATPPWEERDDIYLFMAPRTTWRPKKKYFPITPLGSTVKLVYDINIMKLIYDCLDAMRVTRDDAEELLRELNAALPDVISGIKSRYDIVDMLVKKWLLRYGGDPSQYKKQTRAFDALAALADRLIREHVNTLEGTGAHEVMEGLESALKAVASEEKMPLMNRLGPALAALFLTAQAADLVTIETMASLINSLVDEDTTLTAESIERIQISDIVEDIRGCGVVAPIQEMENVVAAAIECLKAQLLSDTEKEELEEEVEQAMAIHGKSPRTTFAPSAAHITQVTSMHSAHSAHSAHSGMLAAGSAHSTRSQRSVRTEHTNILERTASDCSTRSKRSIASVRLAEQPETIEYVTSVHDIEDTVSGHESGDAAASDPADTEEGTASGPADTGDGASVHADTEEGTASAPANTRASASVYPETEGDTPSEYADTEGVAVSEFADTEGGAASEYTDTGEGAASEYADTGEGAASEYADTGEGAASEYLDTGENDASVHADTAKSSAHEADVKETDSVRKQEPADD